MPPGAPSIDGIGDRFGRVIRPKKFSVATGLCKLQSPISFGAGLYRENTYRRASEIATFMILILGAS